MTKKGSQMRKGGKWLWILVLVAVALIWWHFRAERDHTERLPEPANAAAFADPDDILVDLIDDATDKQVEALERDFGIDLVLVSDQSEDEQFYRAHVDASKRDAILKGLEKSSVVEIAEPDAEYSLRMDTALRGPIRPETVKAQHELGYGPYRVSAPKANYKDYPNDPLYKHQWHMDQIKMPKAWPLADGNDVIVAVLDTGIAYEDYGSGRFHEVEDLKGSRYVKSFDFVDNDKHANDDHGHGTHVTGTIAQITHNGIGVAGIARNVRIMPLKVLGGNGSGSVAGIADAIRYAADEGAHVLNMSLGGPFPSRVLKKAVEYAHSKGVVVVCAAGNNGGRVGYPAAYPGAIAVSATQFDETITFYSNYGKTIDIAAPGGNVRVDQNGDGMPDGVLQNTIVIGDPTKSDYFGFMGTSMAAPHVAGVAALIVGEGVTNPDAVEQILESTAREPSGPAFDKARYGAGIIDAKAAVLKARSDAGSAQWLLGMLVAGAVLFTSRRRLFISNRSVAAYFTAATIGASGLFFLPWIAPSLSSVAGLEVLTRGFPSWTLGVFGVEAHALPLLLSVGFPLVLVGLFYGARRLRPVVAGLIAGSGAHLGFYAASGWVDVRGLSATADTIWLAVNAALCVAIAAVAVRGMPAENSE